ncbi:peptidyl-tRNA hydrolase [Thalassobaculum fulvum]|uniref:Peptidyl-tRNA hydrolase n=1 Tax=Thalassobaculum fulvum TaxID=1633335 RepID=A0A918XTV4_9PROT|nr:aminoacyl-tRNA hydrolase [Thalassobaculum fulvum]GHD53907.1 peptidyl-tRNA hydrolase [Thalassobaculum fulvum]
MLLFVGLGNPGPSYEGNRHNIGFMAIEEIARHHGFGPWRSRFQGLVAEGTIAGHKVLALKPLTYMNESGRSVGEAVRFFKLEPSAVYVFYDELDLVPGKMRVKTGGGAGGHNGIRSIDRHIGQAYHRIRLGIGHPGDKAKVHGYVLSDFAKAERTSWLPVLIDSVAREVPALVDGDEGRFMSRVAHAVFPPPPKPDTPKPARPEPIKSDPAMTASTDAPQPKDGA